MDARLKAGHDGLGVTNTSRFVQWHPLRRDISGQRFERALAVAGQIHGRAGTARDILPGIALVVHRRGSLAGGARGAGAQSHESLSSGSRRDALEAAQTIDSTHRLLYSSPKKGAIE